VFVSTFSAPVGFLLTFTSNWHSSGISGVSRFNRVSRVSRVGMFGKVSRVSRVGRDSRGSRISRVSTFNRVSRVFTFFPPYQTGAGRGAPKAPFSPVSRGRVSRGDRIQAMREARGLARGE
jgi:hypothetical protein